MHRFGLAVSRLGLLSFAVLAGCVMFAASASANGVLFIYRPPASWWGAGESPIVKIDGKTVGRLGRADVIKLSVKSGHHAVKVSLSMFWLPFPGGETVDVKVPENGAGYVRVVQSVQDIIVSPSPVVTHQIQVNVVTAGIANLELRRK
jgi:hypothetical protein